MWNGRSLESPGFLDSYSWRSRHCSSTANTIPMVNHGDSSMMLWGRVSAAGIVQTWGEDYLNTNSKWKPVAECTQSDNVQISAWQQSEAYRKDNTGVDSGTALHVKVVQPKPRFKPHYTCRGRLEKCTSQIPPSQCHRVAFNTYRDSHTELRVWIFF